MLLQYFRIPIFFFSVFLLFSSCTSFDFEDSFVFDVHFVVLTNRPQFLREVEKELFENEIDILNRYFVTADRKEIVRFRLGSVRLYDQVKNSKCLFVQEVVDVKKYHDYSHLKSLYNACDDRNVRSSEAINFYIYDSYASQNGFLDKTSRGYNNSGHPFVMLDWERLGHTLQSPEEHEMGHAFGLRHVCEEGATRNSSTNIMASSGGCNGNGGLRNIGFTEAQVNVILQHAREMQVTLNTR